MNRLLQTFLIVAVAGLAVVSAVLFSRYQTTQVAYTQVKAADDQSESRYARTINAIAEIQDSLNAISSEETKLSSSSARAEQSMGQNGQEALDRIAVLRASILRNKQRIVQLESSLHKSGIQVAGLQKMIKGLKKSVAEKEDLVAQLTGQVDSLHTQVTGLANTVQENQDTLRVRDQTLEERRRELATVYYIMGDKSSLQHSGVITAKGGVLGLGKTLTPTGKLTDSGFTPLDTDQETVVQIPTAKARVLSAQPPSSYQLVIVGKKLELHILDPKEFRKVKDVVIMTA